MWKGGGTKGFGVYLMRYLQVLVILKAHTIKMFPLLKGGGGAKSFNLS